MWIQTTFLICTVAASALAEYTAFKYSMCDTASVGDALTIQRVQVTPTPVEVPGDIHLSIDANLTRPIGSSKMEISLKRETFLLEVPIPCILHVGSCTFNDLCVMVDNMITQNWAGIMGGIGKDVKTMLSEAGVDAGQCPQPARELHIHQFPIHIPEIPAVLTWFAAGDYHAKVKVTENASNKEILCMDLHISVKQKSSGGFLSSIFG